MDITKVMDIVNRSAVARQDTSKTSVPARSQQRMQYSARIIITFLLAVGTCTVVPGGAKFCNIK